LYADTNAVLSPGKVDLKTAFAPRAEFGADGVVRYYYDEPGTADTPPDSVQPRCDGGALLICDEMITGFGRTGRYWGTDHSGVRPDIVTIGKAFGGGFPLTGVLTTEPIAKSKPWSNPSGSSSSYGGNPLGAAAGAAALRIIDDERLVENARVIGATLLDLLRPFVDDFPFVGEVRGRGMMLAIELVKEKKTREPISTAASRRIYDACVQRGLLTMAYAPRVRLQPALTLDAATARNGVENLREVFVRAREEKWWLL
jgi:4-aminobutyrate aminotransferase-like enzyme